MSKSSQSKLFSDLSAQMELPDGADEQASVEQKTVECLGMTFENDEARRAYFTEKLREKLRDPEFRSIEGFPIGEDEDILRLSDPPYYTACPNPFLADFIKHYGKPYDPNSDNYRREPFAADVSEGKNDPIYNAHSYHTKVPHKAIMRYILHYTEPGDVVFDGFCGTGMTGVAAQICGDRLAVETLGYSVENGVVLDEEGNSFSSLGPRHSILNDLSPLASFIAYNNNSSVDIRAFERESKRILDKVGDEFGWVYRTLHQPKTEQVENALKMLNAIPPEELRDEFAAQGISTGQINYVVWSEVFICSECSKEILYWAHGVNLEKGLSMNTFLCPYCKVILDKGELERAKETGWDALIGKSLTSAKLVPVLVSYKVGSKTYQKKPDKYDQFLVEKVKQIVKANVLLTRELPYLHMSHERNNLPSSHGVKYTHHFFTTRNYLYLSRLWQSAMNSKHSRTLLSILTSTIDNHISRRNRYLIDMHHPKGTPGGPLTNTLYLPALQSEINIENVWKKTSKKIVKRLQSQSFGGSIAINTGSATSTYISEACANKSSLKSDR